jgi:hypothetical protein
MLRSHRWKFIAAVLVLGGIAGRLPVAAATSLTDNYNSDTSANYSIVSSSADTSVTFAFDYSALGIPPAPHTTDGTTLGLKIKANIVAPGDPEGITLHTNDVFFGDYVVRFDVWMNANGPFPGGGAGSTEFLTAGVGGDGVTVNRGNATGSGGWIAISGEGGASRDYRMYKAGGEQFAESAQFEAGNISDVGGGAHNSSDPYYAGFLGVDVAELPVQGANHGGPAQQTGTTVVGSLGFGWHEIELLVDPDGGSLGLAAMKWRVDGLLIGTLNAGRGNSFISDGSVTLGYMDVIVPSISDNPDLSFGLIDNLYVAELVAGDYSGNGRVDTADYVVWRNTLNEFVDQGTGADGSGPLGVPDGFVDRFDYVFWKDRYAASLGVGTAHQSEVPEPSSCLTAIVFALALLKSRRARGIGRLSRRTGVDLS